MARGQAGGCGACGEAVGGRRLYCSDRCRLTAWALRRAQAVRPHRRVRPRTWEVAEPDAVPREYLVVSAARIERALREGREVPGVRRLPVEAGER